MSRVHPPVEERLKAGLLVNEVTGCWEWTKAGDAAGYGRIYHNGRLRKVSRVMFELHIGPLNSDLMVCHRCDNPRCANPAHLYAGTALENSRDAVARKRVQAGSRHYRAVLNEDQVAEIRALRADGLMVKEIARLMRQKFRTIAAVIYRENWRG